MRILFLNVQKRAIDCRRLLKMARRPHVVILAELLQSNQKHYEDGLKKTLKHMSRATIYSRRRHVRIYSKYALETDRRTSDRGNKLKNNWVRCRIKGVTISAVHMPTRRKKLKPYAQLKRWMKKQVSSRTLMIGDFNTDTAKDIRFGPELIEWVKLGWRNLWDETPGGDKAWTFKGKRKGDEERRIDHAFVGKGLKARLTHLPAFREKNLTDHSGLLVTIKPGK